MIGLTRDGQTANLPGVVTGRLESTSGYDILAPDMAKFKVSLRIRELAEPVGITNPYELSKRTKMPYESCRLIWSENTRRIDLATIEKLCEVFGVIPGQLFTYEILPDEEDESPTQPASKRKRKS